MIRIPFSNTNHFSQVTSGEIVQERREAGRRDTVARKSVHIYFPGMNNRIAKKKKKKKKQDSQDFAFNPKENVYNAKET